jgi:hypothetical protein
MQNEPDVPQVAPTDTSASAFVPDTATEKVRIASAMARRGCKLHGIDPFYALEQESQGQKDT